MGLMLEAIHQHKRGGTKNVSDVRKNLWNTQNAGTRHQGVTTVEKMGISLKNAESCKSICSHGVEQVQNK